MGGVIGGNHQGIKSLKTASASVDRALLYISQPCFLLVRIQSGNKNVAVMAGGAAVPGPAGGFKLTIFTPLKRGTLSEQTDVF